VTHDLAAIGRGGDAVNARIAPTRAPFRVIPGKCIKPETAWRSEPFSPYSTTDRRHLEVVADSPLPTTILVGEETLVAPHAVARAERDYCLARNLRFPE
jgi:hypothetical protein